MNNCKDCKFFGKEVMHFDHDLLEDVPTGIHTCELITHHDQFGKPPFRPHVVDASGYFAALRVPADFGCNRFDPIKVNEK